MFVPIGVDQVRVELGQNSDLEVAKAIISKPGRLEFREQTYTPSLNKAEWKTVMDSSLIDRAVAAEGYSGRGWEVQFELTEIGTQRFADITRRLVGKPIGIFLDGRELSAPTVQNSITGGRGVITGLDGRLDPKTKKKIEARQEAEELAGFLNAGFLPVNVEIKSP